MYIALTRATGPPDGERHRVSIAKGVQLFVPSCFGLECAGPVGAVADAGRATPRGRRAATALAPRGLRAAAYGRDRAGSAVHWTRRKNRTERNRA